VGKPVVQPHAIVFIEYAPGLARAAAPRHENTAIGIRAVWMSVYDLQAAARAYGFIGLPPGPTLQAPRLAATDREVPAGEGVILRLHGSGARYSLNR
jgi:hypothetical protein